MGRKIEVDIDDLFDLLMNLIDGEYSTYDIFEIIEDCTIKDIDQYAKKSDFYDEVKRDLIGIFKGYTGEKVVSKMMEHEDDNKTF